MDSFNHLDDLIILSGPAALPPLSLLNILLMSSNNFGSNLNFGFNTNYFSPLVQQQPSFGGHTFFVDLQFSVLPTYDRNDRMLNPSSFVKHVSIISYWFGWVGRIKV